VPQYEGTFYGEMQMNDDDTDAGGDFFVDFIKTVIAIFFFVLFVSIMGSFVWRLIA
jgi:hypothetical protein